MYMYFHKRVAVLVHTYAVDVCCYLLFVGEQHLFCWTLNKNNMLSIYLGLFNRLEYHWMHLRDSLLMSDRNSEHIHFLIDTPTHGYMHHIPVW